MLIFEYGNSLDRVCRVLYCNLEVLLADVIPVERDMVRFFERRILCPRSESSFFLLLFLHNREVT